jgi:hypothetical protein
MTITYLFSVFLCICLFPDRFGNITGAHNTMSQHYTAVFSVGGDGETDPLRYSKRTFKANVHMCITLYYYTLLE